MDPSRRLTSRLAAALAALAIVASVALVACKPAVPPVPEDAIKPDFPIVPVNQRMMPAAKRKAQLPNGFPIEIPVIEGSVVATSVDVGNNTWMYTVETTGPVAAVSDWYTRAYERVQWITSSTTETASTADVRFKKHGARTILQLEAVKHSRVRVRASIGLNQIAPMAY